MQISRHWRLNEQRYRLEGSRLSTGEVRFQPRMEFVEAVEVVETTPTRSTEAPSAQRVAAAAR